MNKNWLWLAGVVALIYWKKSRDEAQGSCHVLCGWKAQMMASTLKAQGDYFALG